jgi:hypothetical protein
MIPSLALEIEQACGLPVTVVDEPLRATINGCGRLMTHGGLNGVWSLHVEATP